MESSTPVSDNICLQLRALESENRLTRGTLDSLRVPAGSEISLADIERIVGENDAPRREFRVLRRNAEYEDWFERLFGMGVPTPNTLPFTTWTSGTPWGDKAAFGLQDAEIPFAEHLLDTLEAGGVHGAIVEFGT